MMRSIAAMMACLLLSGAGVIAEQKQQPKKHKDAKHEAVHHDDVSVPRLTLQVSWSSNDVEIIRRHYGPKYRDLPPGLRKKYQRTGQLPPGWQTKMEPLPATLERECSPLPAGYRRGVLDAHAVIYDVHGVIIDVTVLF